jgi:hypothetical protein
VSRTRLSCAGATGQPARQECGNWAGVKRATECSNGGACAGAVTSKASKKSLIVDRA